MKSEKPLDPIHLDELDLVTGGLGGAYVAPMVPTSYIRKWNSFEICLARGMRPMQCAAESGLRPN
jgi:hypothetical protein